MPSLLTFSYSVLFLLNLRIIKNDRRFASRATALFQVRTRIPTSPTRSSRSVASVFFNREQNEVKKDEEDAEARGMAQIDTSSLGEPLPESLIEKIEELLQEEKKLPVQEIDRFFESLPSQQYRQVIAELIQDREKFYDELLLCLMVKTEQKKALHNLSEHYQFFELNELPAFRPWLRKWENFANELRCYIQILDDRRRREIDEMNAEKERQEALLKDFGQHDYEQQDSVTESDNEASEDEVSEEEEVQQEKEELKTEKVTETKAEIRPENQEIAVKLHSPILIISVVILAIFLVKLLF
ncbi:unnamed protein product [Caenorhabditis auriculariae]|uniref:Uncharacterized protein n=1 Tax=Caenorhabditis auriculariae TaxID=2777116 RepID=A0A8S1HL99_9PELO|nr:unnamed protein product [Caenorhabditis auriculariae]